MTHRLNMVLLVLALMFGLPFYWLFMANPSRSVEPEGISIGQLRQLAGSISGQRPTQIDAYVAGWRRIPGNFYAAGAGMKRRNFAMLSWRLEVPGSGPVMIDSGTTSNLAKAVHAEAFVPSAQARIDRGLAQAGLILITSERPQHLGGLAAFAATRDAPMALTRARLAAGQAPGSVTAAAAGWPATLVLRPAIVGQRPVAVAPGIVAIPTGTPTPGSQMIYVRLAGGREYLFAGDLAPFHVNFTELRLRSHLLDLHASGTLRRAQMRWLVTLRELARTAPDLVVVPGHDIDWMSDVLNRTGIRVVG